ncbi:MAG: rhomboid family intramembrane serine protease [Phycisphaeraceae bacterium]|nr:rhomboid family intramembrane serine protease [Phycisphaeraceae bacterium]
MFIPYHVDVPKRRLPVANFAIIGVTLFYYVVTVMSGGIQRGDPLVLDGWAPTGMFGAVLLHADLVHLLGNMLFLWLFGNAVCAKLGNVPYLAVYALLAFVSAAVHNIFDGSPAIGASGAINGIVGMFLIWYPRNNISCYRFFIVVFDTFRCSSIWMILLWFAFDIWGVVSGGDGIAYHAHIGGLIGGALLAILLLQKRMVEMRPTEESLLDWIGWGRTQRASMPARGDTTEPRPETSARSLSAPDAPRSTATTSATLAPARAIRFTCSCGRSMRINARHAGRRARCPVCGNTIQIPTA